MEEQDNLKNEIRELESKLDPLKKRLNSLFLEEGEQTDAKIKLCHSGAAKFGLDELIFAAYTRCACGAGMAYPKKIGFHGFWDCSDILLGRAKKHNEEGSCKHDGPMPFAFYSVKSEDQPSAKGNTTRPKN